MSKVGAMEMSKVVALSMTIADDNNDVESNNDDGVE